MEFIFYLLGLAQISPNLFSQIHYSNNVGKVLSEKMCSFTLARDSFFDTLHCSQGVCVFGTLYLEFPQLHSAQIHLIHSL